MLSLFGCNLNFLEAINLLNENISWMMTSCSSKVDYFKNDYRIKSRLGYTPSLSEMLNPWDVYEFF